MDNNLRKVFAQLHADLLPYCVISGGAAVDFDKATDVDVFVLNFKGIADDFERKKEIFKLSQGRDGYAGKSHPESKADSPEYSSGNTEVICSPCGPAGKSVQIIDCKHKTPVELLDSFDLLTHAVAWLPDGTRVVHGGGYERLLEAPRLGKTIHSPELTLQRYRKLCLRYKLQPNPDDLVKLVLMPKKIAVSAELLTEGVL